MSFAQNLATLKGKVVELKDNKTVGVPGVVVSVSGESYDITGQDGSFKLVAPKGLDFVTITIKGASSTMISPFEGKVHLPPQYEPIEITLCNENNQKLLRKVLELNNKVKSLQKSNRLSTQQAERLQRTMLDTILHYQSKVESLTYELTQTNQENIELKKQINALENQNTLLEQRLLDALGEKFKNQLIAFQTISTGLNNYISRLKDMQLILPTDAFACAGNTPGACDRFYTSIEKYNIARNFIYEHKDEQIGLTSAYWTNESLALQLDKTYKYILDTIHEPMLFEKLNQTVINLLKQRSTGQISLKAAKKEIQTNSKSIAEDLIPMIKELEKMKEKLYFDYKNTVQ